MLKNDKKNKNLLYLVITLCIILVISVILSYIVLSNKNNQKKMLNNYNIYNNILIAGIDVSHMSKEEAFKAIQNVELNEKVTLTYNDKSYTLDKKYFGLTLDKQNALNNAYNIGRNGDKKERLKTIKNLDKEPVRIEIVRNIDEKVAKDKLNKISQNINIEPKNATIEKKDDRFIVTEEIDGLSVDIDKTYEELSKALKTEGDSSIEIIVSKTEAKYKAKDLYNIKDELGTFSTTFTNKGGKDENRIINMKVAASKIDGTILYAGEVFSTNEKFGIMTEANGYKPAPTILNGKFIDEYGGGVCQISSTLYNAALYSELEIVERQNHSLKVGYLDYGYDATLAGDYIDLKFKNTTNYPIYIKTSFTDNEFKVSIYGYDERPKNREIKLQNALIDVIEPSPKIIKETNELTEGQEKIVVKALKGYKYKLYKLIYEDGKLKEKVLVNSSYYKPRAEEVLVGTKKTQPVIKQKENPITDAKKEDIQNSETIVEELTKEVENEEETQEITEDAIGETTSYEEISIEETSEETSVQENEIE